MGFRKGLILSYFGAQPEKKPDKMLVLLPAFYSPPARFCSFFSIDKLLFSARARLFD